MDKIRVYVNSIEPSAVDYIDMKSIAHPCSRAGDRAFEGLKNLPGHSSGFISEEEKKTIDLVERFSRENGLEYEIIDLANAGATTQLRFIVKGWKVPIISFGKETIKGLPTKEQLESMMQK